MANGVADIRAKARAQVCEDIPKWRKTLADIALWDTVGNFDDRRRSYIETAHILRTFVGSRGALPPYLNYGGLVPSYAMGVYSSDLEAAERHIVLAMGEVPSVDTSREHLAWAHVLISYVVEAIAKEAGADEQAKEDGG